MMLSKPATLALLRYWVHMTPRQDNPDSLPWTESSAQAGLDASPRVARAVARFTGSLQRSVVVRSLRGPTLSVGMRENVRRPAASLIKLPLAMALYDLAATGSIAANIPVKRNDIRSSRYPSILEVFAPNHKFLLSELCGIMLATSDNPSAQYILDLIGISRVNAFLADRQCNNTRMVVGYRDHELISPLARSNYSTAHDMANLLGIAYSEERYAPLLKSLTNGLRKSRIPFRLPEDLPVANKTGTLDGVVDDAAIIYGNNYDLSVTIFADAEENEPLTEKEIADFVATVWRSLGERLDERREP
jgi:beta-lactamase class A